MEINLKLKTLNLTSRHIISLRARSATQNHSLSRSVKAVKFNFEVRFLSMFLGREAPPNVINDGTNFELVGGDSLCL